MGTQINLLDQKKLKKYKGVQVLHGIMYKGFKHCELLPCTHSLNGEKNEKVL